MFNAYILKFNTHSSVLFPFCTQIHFFPLYCYSLFFITIISTYRFPPACAHLAHVSARQDAAATRHIIHCQRCYDFVSSYLFLPALLRVIAPMAFPPYFVTLYKVKRSMKTLLICKWVSVKDRDLPLSETPRCASVVEVRLIWTLNKQRSPMKMCASGLFTALAVWQQE